MMAALYPTKKALKQAVGQTLRYRETSLFGNEFQRNGRFCVVGPDEHTRRWFAEVTMADGIIKAVR